MKHILLIFILLGLILAPCWSLESLDMEITGGINKMTFHPDRVTAHGISQKYKAFEGYPYGYGNLVVTGGISEKIGFILDLSRDNMLWNSFCGKFAANSDNFNLEFGPFVTMTDKLEVPMIGIAGKFGYALPGIFFVTLDGSSSIGSKWKGMSDNSQGTAKLLLGFWIPYVITSLSAEYKTFTRFPKESFTTRDELIRFQLSADIHTKAIPVKFRVDAGYEIFSRQYTRDIPDYPENTDVLNAIFAGLEVRWQISRPLQLIVAAEYPFYRIAAAPMEKPKLFDLYKFGAGVAYNFPIKVKE